MNNSKQRYAFLDTLKAFGIFFIYLGHYSLTSRDLLAYIFSFHLPLFFMISGMMFNPVKISNGFTAFIKNKFRTRLIPYFFFGFTTYFFWLLKRFIGYGEETNLIHPLKPLVGMFYGLGIDGWLAHNALLWFLTCLVVTEIYFFLIIRISSQKASIICTLIVCACLGYVTSHLIILPFRPFNFDVAFVATTFYGIGYLLKDYLLTAKANYWIIFFSGVIGILFSILNNMIPVMSGHYYGNYLFFYIASISSSFFWLFTAKKIPDIKLVIFIGQNTLSLFALQVVGFNIVAVLIKVLGLQITYPNNLLSIFLSVCAIIALLPIVKFLNQYLPFCVANNRKPRS